IDTTARQTAQGGRDAIKDVRDDLDDLTGPWPYEIDNTGAETAVTAIQSVRDELLALDGTVATVGVVVETSGVPGAPGGTSGGFPGGPVTPPPPSSGGGGMADVGVQGFIPGFPGGPAAAQTPAGPPNISVNLFINMTPQGGMSPGNFASQVASV